MMINYSDKYLIIAGIALVELIFLYVIIQGIFALKEEKEISGTCRGFGEGTRLPCVRFSPSVCKAVLGSSYL